MFKKSFVVAICLSLVLGCAAIIPQAGFNDPIYQDPEAGKSIILATSVRIGVPVDQLDMIFKDAAAVGVILDAYSTQQALDVIDTIEKYVAAPFTYRSLIELVMDETSKAGKVALLVSNHLPEFDSTRFISNIDKRLILKHLENQRKMMGG